MSGFRHAFAQRRSDAFEPSGGGTFGIELPGFGQQEGQLSELRQLLKPYGRDFPMIKDEVVAVYSLKQRRRRGLAPGKIF